MEERRKHERFEFWLPTKVQILSKYPNLQSRAPREESMKSYFAQNISAGGAFLACTKRLPEGTRVQLFMALSLENELSVRGRTSRIIVRGRVARSSSEGTAICFDKRYKIEPLLNRSWKG